MPVYVENFLEVKRKSTLPIRLGAEIDFFPQDTEKIKAFIQKYPFDYVIGSVHYIGKWSIDSRKQIDEYQRRDISQVYQEYFSLIQNLAQSRLFDILGHADLIKIFGYKPKNNIDKILKETAEAIAESNLCIEVNTSGLIRPCAEMYPSRQFLTILKQNDVPITLGSDAHNPNNIRRRFNEALWLMKEIGYKQICIFEARKRKKKEILQCK